MELAKKIDDGDILVETSIQTLKNVKVADVCWAPSQFIEKFGFETPYTKAPKLKNLFQHRNAMNSRRLLTKSTSALAEENSRANNADFVNFLWNYCAHVARRSSAAAHSC